MNWKWILLSIVGLLLIWIVIDLNIATAANLRVFDAREVGRLETDMWRSYYDHEPVKLYRQLGELLRRQYGFPFWRSQLGAFYAARAAVVFQRGKQRSDYLLALPMLEKYYQLIADSSSTQFNVKTAAALEVEWWIIHRQRAEHDPKDLVNALAALQSEIYSQPAGDFIPHAQDRADAMIIRDERAAAGGVSETEWAQIGQLLDRSWTSLHNAVQSKAATRTQLRP